MSWILPSDFSSLRKHCDDSKRKGKQATYIFKPPNSAQVRCVRPPSLGQVAQTLFCSLKISTLPAPLASCGLLFASPRLDAADILLSVASRLFSPGLPSPQGRGIQLTRTLEDIPADGTMLVQEYLPKPFLIDGFKFDLRLYVLVTSYEPLRVFLCVLHCHSLRGASGHGHSMEVAHDRLDCPAFSTPAHALVSLRTFLD